MKLVTSPTPGLQLPSLLEANLADLARLAAQICGTTMAAVTRIDGDGRWHIEAGFGLEGADSGGGQPICTHTIRQTDILIVGDTRQDPRFYNYPATLNGLPLRFYAGAPLRLHNPLDAGALCVFDCEPHVLDNAQRESLRALSRQVAAQFDLDRTVRELDQTVRKLQQVAAEREETERALRASEVQFQTFMDNAPIIAFLKDPDGRFLYVNESAATRFNLPRAKWLGHTDAELFGAENARPWREHDLLVLARDELIATEEEVPTAEGMQTWLTHKFPLRDASGRPVLAATNVDITDRKRIEREREQLLIELSAALTQVKTLRGLIPICATCKSIRDDAGYWQLLEGYIAEHSEAEFTHGICPACLRKDYPEFSADAERPETPAKPTRAAATTARRARKR